ncbi:hypothetical protein [Tenuifilum thalassicum]|uniref:hypothetical protein n=1 Tax=Tenuifilum thalassicum TaxID=2590900 RepID=UPI001C6FE23D|nr:hypothetical protein [Tenuifilum thalassicum]
MKAVQIILTFIILLFSQNLFADDPIKILKQKITEEKQIVLKDDTVTIKPYWFAPTQFKFQYAGSIGFISIGAGYQLRHGYQPTLLYGFLDNNFGGSNVTVHTISLKNRFNLSEKPILGFFTPIAGISVNWGITHNTFKRLPPHYRENYYFQNKVHLSPFWGGEFQIPIAQNTLGIYFEFSTLDAYLLEFVRTDFVRWNDVWSLGLGMTLYL